MSYNPIIITGICPVCFTEKELNLTPCCHEFCLNCISTYLELKILENDVRFIPCLQCDKELDSSYIIEKIDKCLFEKYKKFKLIKEIEQDIYVKWCPIPGCNGYDVASISNFNLICKECGFKYCYRCSKPWHDKKCKIFEDKNFLNWAKKENVRICPKCKSFVQKAGGCPHMQCGKCDYKWCWICGKDYSSSDHTSFTCYFARSKFDFYWYTIIFFILFPLAIPFWLFVLFIYKLEIADDFFLETSKLKRFKLYVYPMVFLLSPVGFIGLPLVPFIILGSLFHRLSKVLKFGRCCFTIFFRYLLVLVLSVLLLGVILIAVCGMVCLGVIVLPPLGTVLLIIKVFLLLIKCFKPSVYQYPRSLTY